MIKLIALLILCLSADYCTASCPKFTPEQDSLIHRAYYHGSPEGLGHTLAAITWQESFVWKYVQKVNPKDGKYGSYGVTHINLTTAMWLTGEKSKHKALAELAPMLMSNDTYSFELSLRKLNRTKGPWSRKVQRYNGSGPMARKYLTSVRKKVTVLKNCYNFGE